MAKKEKVSIRREEAFEEVESALSDAIANLEATNARISALLNSDSHELPDDFTEDAAPLDKETSEEASSPAEQSGEGGEAASEQDAVQPENTAQDETQPSETD